MSTARLVYKLKDMLVRRMSSYVVTVLFVLVYGLSVVTGQIHCVPGCYCEATEERPEMYWSVCAHRTLGSNTLIIGNDTDRILKLTIYCWGQNRSEIAAGAFEAFSRLESLEILSCSLSSIPALAFDGLPLLRNLTLSRVSSPILEPGWLSPLKSLEELDISESELTQLDPRTFCDVPTLRHLNISSNNFTHQSQLGLQCVPSTGSSDCMPCLSALQKLDLSANPLKEFDLKLSVAAPNLTDIRLDQCGFTYLGSNVFKDLTQIETIIMSSNPLRNLPSDVFLNLDTLTTVELNGDQLTQLPGMLFSTAKNVRVLELIENNLGNQLEFLRYLSNMQGFNLNDNKITTLTEGLFENNVMLQKLSMQQNMLETIEKGAFRNTVIDVLAMAENKLKVLTNGSLEGLQLLKLLSISFNEIRHIEDEVFADTPFLTFLLLNNNKLAKIPQALSALTYLNSLDLGFNSIAQIEPDTLTELRGLGDLRLGSNKIEAIPNATFSRNNELRFLNLSENNIRELHPGCFMGLEKLQALIMGHNEIADLGEVLLDLTALETLELQNNQIEKLKYNMFPDTLKVVNLTKNMISYIDPHTFSAKRNLVIVDISHNRLVMFSPSSMIFTSMIPPIVFIQGNVMTCQCLVKVENISQSAVCTGDFLEHEQFGKTLFREYVGLEIVLCSYREECYPINCDCCGLGPSSCGCASYCPSSCSCFSSANQTDNIVNCESEEMSEIPASLPRMAKTLILSGNNLKVVKSKVFSKHDLLVTLYMNSSNIEKIEGDAFGGLRSLKELDLHNNKLSRLERKSFQGLTSLEKLDLRSNKITTIEDDTFTPLVSLKELHLGDNRLTVVDARRAGLHGRPSLLVTFEDNPLGCDSVRNLRQWIKNQTACAHGGTKLASFFNLTTIVGIAVAGGVFLILVIIIIVCCVVCCRRKRRRKDPEGIVNEGVSYGMPTIESENKKTDLAEDKREDPTEDNKVDLTEDEKVDLTEHKKADLSDKAD